MIEQTTQVDLTPSQIRFIMDMMMVADSKSFYHKSVDDGTLYNQLSNCLPSPPVASNWCILHKSSRNTPWTKSPQQQEVEPMVRSLCVLVVINHPEYITLHGQHYHVLTATNLLTNSIGFYYEWSNVRSLVTPESRSSRTSMAEWHAILDRWHATRATVTRSIGSSAVMVRSVPLK